MPTKKSEEERSICRTCGIKLSDENRYPSHKKNRQYICKECYWKSIKGYKKDYLRRRQVFTTGRKRLLGEKRKWTNICELCGNKRKVLPYHHWDDNDLRKGVWLCGKCHHKIEIYEGLVELEFVEKWLKLKEKVEAEILCT